MKKRHNYSRTDRVSQQVHEIVASLLLKDVKDPRVQDVHVTAVEVTNDLQIAKVFFVMLENEGKPNDDVFEGLERVSGYLRRELGNSISMRYTPELRFEYDESIERGRRMEALLSELDIPDREDGDDD
jgi:ribosome-binding factor A